MAKKNAKSQALRVRGDQKISNSINHLNRSGEVEGDGTRLENQSIRTGGEDCTGHNSGRCKGGTTVGGILNQLIEEAKDQLVYHESQIKKLEQRIEQLQQLYEEQQEAGEDDSEPVETNE